MPATMDGSTEGSNLGDQLPFKIAGDLKKFGLQPTPAAVTLLRSASQLGEHKESDQDVLSASGLLFAVVELVRRQIKNPSEPIPHDYEQTALQIVARFFLGEENKYEEEFEKVVMTDFYNQKYGYRIWYNSKPRPTTYFSFRMQSEIEKLHGSKILDVVDLIAASLASPGEYLQRRLDQLAINAEELRSIILDLKVSGFNAHFRREQAGPLVLGADQYALALARLFRIAESEFSLALLAPWGMGKTTISREIQRYLAQPHDYVAELQRAVGHAAEGESTAQYEIVTFSAWTYRRQPELWIWLYESFVKAFLARGPLVSSLRIFRCGIAKHGFGSLYKSLLLMAFLAFPLTWIAAAINAGIALFGAVGLVTVGLLGRRWFVPVRTLIDRYGVIGSHREGLGLQALIGDDLRALVDAWVRGGGPRPRAIFIFAGFLAGVATLWAFVILNGGPASGKIQAAMCELHSVLCTDQEENAASSDWFAWSAWSAWIVIGLMALLSVIVPWGRADRVLLIVDDLDRCPPDEIIDLIDGVKLMLEEQQVGKYVQALVLADSRVLEHAIRKRFRDFVFEIGEDSDARLKRVVREHMEKVFLCQFRLRPLNKRNIRELAATFAREFESTDNEPKDSPAKGERPDVLKDIVSPLAPVVSEREEQKHEPIQTSEPFLNKTLTFSTSEKKMIARVIEHHFGSGQGEDAPTPRFIRSFMFKYQLARMILQMGRRSCSATDVAEKLAHALKASNSKEQDAKADDDELTLVTRQVA